MYEVGQKIEWWRGKIIINEMYEIDISTIEKAKRFNEIALSFEEDIDVIKDRYTIDAKSILGIFSLDISKPLLIKLHTKDEHIRNLFCEKISEFVIEDK